MKSAILNTAFVFLITLSANTSANASEVVINKIEGTAPIYLNTKTLFASEASSVAFYLIWPEINYWSSINHQTTIRDYSANRDREINEVITKASHNFGYLNAKVTSEIYFREYTLYPGCHKRPYMTCEDLGYEPVSVKEKRERIKLQIDQFEVFSDVLIERTQ